jgi:hypothetical protein
MTSVGSILGGAFRLVRDHPLSVLVWGLIHAAAFAALFLAMRPLFQVYADFFSAMFAQQLAAGPGKPMDPQMFQPYVARMQAAGGIVFLAELGLFALLAIIFTATQRAVLRPGQRSFFFLRFGGDELRLMGLGFFLMVCLVIANIVAMLMMGIVVAIVAVASGSGAVAGLLLLAAYLVLMAATIYVEVRFSLAFPLTFVRGTFIIGEAWRLSRGRFWTLFGAYFVIMLLYMVLAAILFGVAIAPLVSELSQAPSTPEAVQLALQHQLERFTEPSPYTLGLAAAWALLGGLVIALFGGAAATAARDLLAGDPVLTAGSGE